MRAPPHARRLSARAPRHGPTGSRSLRGAARGLIRRAKYHVGITSPRSKTPGAPGLQEHGAMKCPRGDTLPTHTLSGFPKLTGDARRRQRAHAGQRNCQRRTLELQFGAVLQRLQQVVGTRPGRVLLLGASAGAGTHHSSAESPTVSDTTESDGVLRGPTVAARLTGETL